ncbi:MAG: hypothetical protein ACOYOK_13110 [Pseudobdellovibrionaceae bacterium]
MQTVKAAKKVPQAKVQKNIAPAPVVVAASAQDQSIEKSLIDGNIAISEWFDGVAEGIDVFLVGGKKISQRKNETHVVLGNTTSYDESSGSVHNSNSLNVNLRLPNLEDYWQLKFTSYDEAEERRNKDRFLRKQSRQQNYGASVGIFKNWGKIRTAFQPRVTLQNPISIAHSLAFESVIDLKTYQINPKLEFFANPDKGAGVFQALNFHIPLNKIFSLTLINEGEYQSSSYLYSVSNGFSIGQSVSPHSSLAYSWIFSSKNQPNYQLVGHSISVSWNQLIYKNILDYQIVPYLDFEKENSYTGHSGINMNINLNF